MNSNSRAYSYPQAILDPRYGSGCYRRAIVLHRDGPSRVHAAVEDDPHAFAVVLEHDGERVVEVSAEARRFPLTTCPEATQELRALIGAPLVDPLRTLGRWANPRQHCTHLFDLAALAMAHVQRPAATCRYDLTIPDAIDGRSVARLDRDGERVLSWTVQDGVIVDPEPFVGQKVFGGFTGWAREALDEQQYEYSFLLQRGLLVAQSRVFDEEKAPLGPASLDPMRPDSCYSYSALHASRAWRVPGNRQDFTAVGNEALLRWFDPEDAS